MTDAAAGGGARRALRRVTAAVHGRLHHHPVLLPLTRPSLTEGQYREALAALHGFHAPVERRLAAHGAAETTRLGQLARDLAALGIDAAVLPEAEGLPDLSAPPARLAARYVLDGSAHGGRVMLPGVRRALGDRADGATAFLAGDGPGPRDRWTALVARLEEELAAPAALATATATAQSLFIALERWLDWCAAAR